MRCVLSLTAASASPTRIVLGIAAGEMSTSTSTGLASIPNKEYVNSLASMGQADRRGRTPGQTIILSLGMPRRNSQLAGESESSVWEFSPIARQNAQA